MDRLAGVRFGLAGFWDDYTHHPARGINCIRRFPNQLSLPIGERVRDLIHLLAFQCALQELSIRRTEFYK